MNRQTHQRFRQRAIKLVHPSKSTDSTEQFLWEVHKYTNEYIRFADTKAAFTAAASTALIGALVSSSIFNSVFLQNPRQWTMCQWSAGVGLLLLVCSVLSSVMAIRPRLWNQTPVGFIFWDSVVAHETRERFAAAQRKLSASDRTRQVSDHVFALAAIAKRKYALVAIAILSGTIGGILAGSVLLLRHALQ